MQLEVIKNAKKNMIFGFINKAILMICPFFTRTVIQIVLGAQYLGLNSLFVSVLSVLSLSELGFSSAIVYNMYKPVAENDIATVNALLAFYRKVYRVIGTAVMGIGLCLIPILPKLINGAYPDDINLFSLYLLYLINTSISYFMFAYKTSIITVYQREDINSIRNSILTVGQTLLQLLVLYWIKSYFVYVLLSPFFTIINNLWVGLIVKKEFPQYKCEGTISKDKLVDIKKLVVGSFIQKACNVTRNSLDSICVSTFLGLSMTAVYNNYFYIISSITAVMMIISNSLIGGVGNHIATKSPEENFRELKQVDFAYLLLSGWCAICLICLYQPFMELWMGKDMLLPFPAVALFVIYFYMLKLGDMRTMYSAGSGLWWYQKWRAIGETIANFGLNIVLGKLFGVYGIISATIISLLIFNCIWSVGITFNRYFGREKQKYYFVYQIKYTLVTLFVLLITYYICSQVRNNSLWICLFARAGVCCVIPTLLYFLIYRKTKEFDLLLSVINFRRK